MKVIHSSHALHKKILYINTTFGANAIGESHEITKAIEHEIMNPALNDDTIHVQVIDKYFN